MPFPIVAVILIAISIAAQIIMALLSPKPKGPQAEKVDIPTATEGRTVPVNFGTDLQKGPNVTWFGDVQTREKKKRAGSSSVTVGIYYFVGMVWYLCHGPNNRLRSIRMEDKIIWSGSLIDEDEVFIDKSRLFGDSGGVVLDLQFHAGNGSNAPDAYLEAQNPGYPDHRHFCYVVSRGPSTWTTESNWKGYIGLSNSLRPIAFEVERIPDGIALNSLTSDSTTTEGWAVFGPYTGLAWDNTNKYLKFNENNDSSQNLAFVAPSAFLGDLSGAYGGDLAFEIYCSGGDASAAFETKSVKIFNGSDYIKWFYDPDPSPPGDPSVAAGWTALTVNLSTSSDWLWNGGSAATSGQIQGILANVTAIRLGCDFVFNPTEEVRLRNVSLYVALGGIEDPNVAGAFDANPAVFLYELLTNRVWGCGMDPADESDGIDTTAFVTAANTLADEGMGLSFISQDSLLAKDLIAEILRHIDAAFYRNRQTGKWTIRLIRDDYDPDALPVLDESIGIEVENYGADGVGELRDTVRVKFIDRAREYTDSFAVVRSPAVRAAQGFTAPQEVEYPYVRRADLANQFAAREALVVNNALKRVSLTANRLAATFNPGDLFRFQWSEYGADVVMRIGKIGYGPPGDGKITIEAVEDKFALADSLYVAPSGTWTPTDYTALNATYRRVEELPYYYSRDEFARLAAFCAAPSSTHIGYELDTKEGSGDYSEADGDREFAAYSTLVNAISGYEDADDTGSWIVASNAAVAALPAVTGDQQRAGRNLAIVGDELISYESVTSVTGGYRLDGVRHGALDTVPAAHAAGTGIFFVTAGDTSFAVPGIFTAGATITGRFRPYTPSDGINDPNGNTDAITLDGRATRPLPPANITVNGTYRGATAVGYITLEWSERNRLTQTDVRYQDDADVTAESGTTYTVRVYNESDTLIRTEPPTTDTDYTYTESMMVADTGGVLDSVRFEIEAERDGLVSWQPQSIRVEYIEP